MDWGGSVNASQYVLDKYNPAVVVPEAQDIPSIAAMLTRSFVDNRLFDWWLRPRNKSAAMHRYFELVLRSHLDQPGTVSVSHALDACAIWDQPRDAPRWPATIRLLRLLSLLGLDLSSYRPIRLRHVMSELDRYRPWYRPHWYLCYVGVEPVMQGMGVGTALLRAELAARDRAGQSVYLEVIDARARAFYSRFGFEVLTTFELSADVGVTGMWRNPAAREGRDLGELMGSERKIPLKRRTAATRVHRNIKPKVPARPTRRRQ